MTDFNSNLVSLVQFIKSIFAWFQSHQLFGVPLDLEFRFVLMLFLYPVISLFLSRRHGLGICLILLLGKEVFDVFSVRSVSQIHSPQFEDLVDTVSGLLGILVGEGLLRLILAVKGNAEQEPPPHPAENRE